MRKLNKGLTAILGKIMRFWRRIMFCILQGTRRQPCLSVESYARPSAYRRPLTPEHKPAGNMTSPAINKQPLHMSQATTTVTRTSAECQCCRLFLNKHSHTFVSLLKKPSQLLIFGRKSISADRVSYLFDVPILHLHQASH